MKIVVLEDGDKCQFEGCRKKATHIASGRNKYPGVKLYCGTHAYIVADDDNPEYIDCCPNCHCYFGTN